MKVCRLVLTTEMDDLTIFVPREPTPEECRVLEASTIRGKPVETASWTVEDMPIIQIEAYSHPETHLYQLLAEGYAPVFYDGDVFVVTEANIPCWVMFLSSDDFLYESVLPFGGDEFLAGLNSPKNIVPLQPFMASVGAEAELYGPPQVLPSGVYAGYSLPGEVFILAPDTEGMMEVLEFLSEEAEDRILEAYYESHESVEFDPALQGGKTYVSFLM